MFQRLQATIQHDIVRFIFGVQVQVQEPAPPPPVPVAPMMPMPDGQTENGAVVATGPAPLPAPTQAPAVQQHTLGSREAVGVRRPAAAPPPSGKLPGRNDPCYCGSGLKYKKCHGR
jgi:preprotein translocase subunit SecA